MQKDRIVIIDAAQRINSMPQYVGWNFWDIVKMIDHYLETGEIPETD